MPQGRPALDRLKSFFPDATSVVDAGKSITISVEPVDRQGAQRKQPNACAMARACVRKLNVDGAVISLSAAYLLKGRKVTRYKVPPSLRTEIVTFDRFGGKGFASGEYTLYAPTATKKLGRHTHSGGKSTGTKPTRKVHLTEGVRSLA